ncbi:MAG: hypothetical protein JSW35_02060 [Deltaproteobacteria bacterium]|nr:MAG: hypothetical protein JSW35_02060 [Deltaproteobacteria bacterium]
MKGLVIVVTFLVMTLFEGAVLEKDYLSKGRINNKSKTGELKGWMKRDTLQLDRVNVYDKYGNMKGYLVRDTLNPDAWFFKEN